jgi:long-chain acyl-CoA synthetase
MSDDKTLLDVFYENVEKYGDRIFMTQPMGGDAIKTYTFRETLEEADQMAGYIESLKLPPNSQIAICSKNCAWWIIADLACWMTGHVSVPVYPTLTHETTRYILEHSESKLLFIGKLDAKPWAEMKEGIPAGIPTVAFPLCPANHGADKTWEEALAAGTHLETPVHRKKSEMATIIYTSGSTGQ